MLQEKNEDLGNAKGLLINGVTTYYDPVTYVISGITNVELFLTDTPGLWTPVMDPLLCPD